MSIKQVLLLAIVAVVAVLILQNMQTVEIRVLFWKFAASRALVLVGTFILGLAAGMLLRMLWKASPKNDGA